MLQTNMSAFGQDDTFSCCCLDKQRTLACRVETWMALGMMSAVIFLSMRTISEKGRTSCTAER